jgi:hypothetical protein
MGPGGAGPGNAPRGPSTKEWLKLAWDYAVYRSDASKSDGTDVKAKRQALAREDALHAIAGSDPRPLIVLRECQFCNKTDKALLKPGADNERTLLLSRWFHCVKLPVDVIQPDHPFNALFPTNDAEHLFVCSADGSGKIPLESQTSRVELWSAMSRVLSTAYSKDPSAAAKDIVHVFDKLDILDGHVRDLENSRDQLLETAGKLDKDKVQKLEKEIDSAKKEIDASLRSIDRLAKLDLKPAKKAERS